jgi:hypothetical protein
MIVNTLFQKYEVIYFSFIYLIGHNGFGLGAVVCRLVRWENCAKPVLLAGTDLNDKF